MLKPVRGGEMEKSDIVRQQIDSRGVATVSWGDGPGGASLLDPRFFETFSAVAERLIADREVRGVILAGDDESFSGGDRGAGRQASSAETAYREAMRRHALLRRLETGGTPFVAAIGGAALGEGLQLCLACHHRIAVDDDRPLLGLPESRAGRMPSLGGTQRLPRLVGTRSALPLLLDGRPLSPRAAGDLGLVDELAPPDRLLSRARSWIIEHQAPLQRWDARGFEVPGGPPHASAGGQLFTRANALLRTRGGAGLAPGSAILSAVYEGLSVPLDAALRIEARYHAWLATRP